jgi:flagellar motor component MotA
MAIIGTLYGPLFSQTIFAPCQGTLISFLLGAALLRAVIREVVCETEVN